MKDNEWTWSLTQHDVWQNDSFATIEAAIEAGVREAQEFGKSHFLVGRVQDAGLPVISAEDVLDQLGLQAYEEFGEAAEDYLTLGNIDDSEIQELEEKLNEVFAAWATKHGYLPTFCKIDNVEWVEVATLRHTPLVANATCRVCGCTDDLACPGGCYWVEQNLCSRCAEEMEMAAQGTKVI
ncbi:MAG: hypothetical protein C4575_12655 [Desulforudis sp.]|nr:MAG: hypothetical protein C4575_12655 [Desulforudis sp.]